jgi:hypothetical protein
MVVPLLIIGVRADMVTCADPPAVPSAYDAVVQPYLAGKWDELAGKLKSGAKELNALTGPRKADIAYIRQTLAESRPAWWANTKAGMKTAFRANLWGRGFDVTYDPEGKTNIQMNYTGDGVEVVVSWPAADMDNPAPAEHGFSKGTLNELNVFSILGMADAWRTVPAQTFANLGAADKTLLTRVLDLQGNLAGVYYGSPRARQWGLWLFLHSYQAQYAKMPTINARKAVAVAFLVEVLAGPSKYPSIDLPVRLEAENAEENLALAVHPCLEKHGWTLAEDRAMREALKSFAAANAGALRNGGKVTLPHGLVLSLDPDQDTVLRPKRDAWFKKQFDAVHAP